MGFHVSHGTQELHQRHCLFVYGALTRYGRPSQTVRLKQCLVTLPNLCHGSYEALQHQSKNASRLTINWFRLIPVRSPLLRESRLMSFPGGTEMYQFPPFAP